MFWRPRTECFKIFEWKNVISILPKEYYFGTENNKSIRSNISYNSINPVLSIHYLSSDVYRLFKSVINFDEITYDDFISLYGIITDLQQTRDIIWKD